MNGENLIGVYLQQMMRSDFYEIEQMFGYLIIVKCLLIILSEGVIASYRLMDMDGFGLVDIPMLCNMCGLNFVKRKGSLS